MHAVVALALPAVEAFDLAIPAQVFADPGLPRRSEFTSVRLRPGWCGQPREVDQRAVAQFRVITLIGDSGGPLASSMGQLIGMNILRNPAAARSADWPRRAGVFPALPARWRGHLETGGAVRRAVVGC